MSYVILRRSYSYDQFEAFIDIVFCSYSEHEARKQLNNLISNKEEINKELRKRSLYEEGDWYHEYELYQCDRASIVLIDVK